MADSQVTLQLLGRKLGVVEEDLKEHIHARGTTTKQMWHDESRIERALCLPQAHHLARSLTRASLADWSEYDGGTVTVATSGC